MTKKRPQTKKPAAKKKKKKAAAKKQKTPFRFLPALLLTGLIAGLLTTGLYLLLDRSSPPRATTTSRSTTKLPDRPPAPASKKPAPEAIRPGAAARQSPEPAATPAPPVPAAVAEKHGVPAHGKPLAAIVIDDMGHSLSIGKKLIALDLNLSFSFLPYAANTQYLVQQADARSRDILLHQPMEPSRSKWDPGPNALYLRMSEAEMRSAFHRSLAAVPRAIGINNHMGSRFTENWAGMEIFLAEAKKEKLFFLDSFTSPYSVGNLLATRLGVKTAKRDVFLDNVQDKALIKKQLRQFMAVARKNGQAIAIGHPYQATLDALRDLQPQLNRELRLVGIHHLVQ